MKNDKNFIGCYPKDKLPKILPPSFPKKMIINTGISSTKGDHWIALILFKNNCFYFDSFGLEIIDKRILNFLTKLNYKTYTFNNQCIQHFESEKCGNFCIKFLKTVGTKKNFSDFIKKFDFQNLKKNDTIVDKISCL